MRGFRYSPLPANVIFGFGTISRLRQEVERLGCSRALVVTTPEQGALVDLAKEHLKDAFVGAFTNAKMHTPIEVTRLALGYLKEIGADSIVGLGGGSTTGLCKALALRTDLPQIILPTTYAGSEATPILGETADGEKQTQRTIKVLPETIIYDVDLSTTLPTRLSAVSGVNAIAHAVEALYAQQIDPVIAFLAQDGIRTLRSALPIIQQESEHREARSDALYGAWACGSCLGAVGMALHHKLCHVLGGSFDLPHAETHTIVLPHVAAYNRSHAREALSLVADALGSTDAARGLFELNIKLGVPLALKDIGMPEDGIDEAVRLTMSSPYWNPRPIEEAPLRELLDRAYEGLHPSGAF